MANLLILALTLFSLSKKVDSFPTVAGHCESGDQVMKDIYAHGPNGSGRLNFAGYRIYIDNNEISRQSTTVLEKGVEYEISLRQTDSWPFKGFMIRLSDSDGGADVSSAFQVVNSSNTQLNPQCYGDNAIVSSVCHTGNDEKGQIDVKLNFDSAVNLKLDVTVVRDNSPQGSDLWYYDFFNIVIGDPTSSPTGAPVPKPTTDAPVSKPTTDAPVASPTGGEDPDNTFVLRKKNDGSLLLKTCVWLQRQPKKNRHRYCTLPKFTKSYEGYDPAKDVCTETCSEFPCRPDKWGKFVLNIRKTGFVVKRKCKWLQKRNYKKKEEICSSELSSGMTKPASDLCLTTCCEY